MGAAQLIEADETDREGAETHLYTDQLPDEAAIDALHYHTVSYDKTATEHNVAMAEELFGDILPIKACGVMLCSRSGIGLYSGGARKRCSIH
mgnify:FL=1